MNCISSSTLYGGRERDACCLTTDCQRDQQQAHQHHDDGQGTNVVIVCEKSEMLPTLKRNVHEGR